MKSDGTIYKFAGIMMRKANDVKEFWVGKCGAAGQSGKVALGA